MKRLSLIVLVVSLLIMTNSTFGSIKWNTGDGNWNVNTNWDKGYVPIEDGDEIKVASDGNAVAGAVVTINSTLPDYGLQADGFSSGNKMAIANSSSWYMTTDGSIGIRELKIGDSGAGGADDGYIVQDGGRITCADVAGKIEVGYKALGVGTYTMSGGTLDGAGQRLMVATGASSGVATGTFIVDCSGGGTPVIDLDKLYVGNYNTAGDRPGVATVEFKLSAGGTTSVIDTATLCLIDAMNTSVADLVVTVTGTAPTLPLLLIRNAAGAGAVVGQFDSLTVQDGVGNPLLGYSLTYTYNSDGSANDIALIPEPATLVLLGLGSLLALRRKK